MMQMNPSPGCFTSSGCRLNCSLVSKTRPKTPERMRNCRFPSHSTLQIVSFGRTFTAPFFFFPLISSVFFSKTTLQTFKFSLQIACWGPRDSRKSQSR